MPTRDDYEVMAVKEEWRIAKSRSFSLDRRELERVTKNIYSRLMPVVVRDHREAQLFLVDLPFYDRMVNLVEREKQWLLRAADAENTKICYFVAKTVVALQANQAQLLCVYRVL